MRKHTIVAVSGGFDPLHVGHLRMLKEARALGDELVVILNNDNWLRAKKSYAFMPQEERTEILLAFPFVDRVVLTEHLPDDPDRSVCQALAQVRPHIFANGGDRFADDIPELFLCTESGIELVFNIGQGGKVQSSSKLVADAQGTEDGAGT
ncbi:MAG: adenylyltransferase/cytidyltransferase family protein [Patescibacteria group bacterium]